MDQLVSSVMSWFTQAAPDCLLLSIGIWLGTELLSQWNTLDSRKTSVLLTPVLSAVGLVSGYWGKHSWLDIVVLSMFAWKIAEIIHTKFGGKDLSEATIGAVASTVQKLVNGK